jgi:hypothetical protein
MGDLIRGLILGEGGGGGGAGSGSPMILLGPAAQGPST